MLHHVTVRCRQKRWKALVGILLANRSTLKVSAVESILSKSLFLVNVSSNPNYISQLYLLQILLHDMIPSFIPNAESENASDEESTIIAKDKAQSSVKPSAKSDRNMSDRVEAAKVRFEQIRFKLARLGRGRSLHEVFERDRHFYYPQRLWIAFSLSLVGTVFFFALFMFSISEFCKVLVSWRIQILNIIAQIDGFIGAAPTYLQLMSSSLVSGLAGKFVSLTFAT
jgi:hypothetical protein